MTTIYKPYAAFGTAFIRCNATAGTVREVKLGEDGLVLSGYYFYTDGEVQCVVKETGETIDNRTAGWLNLDHLDKGAASSGTLLVTPLVDTEWFCINKEMNKIKGLPALTAVILAPEQTRELANPTDFFLAKGTALVNEKRFEGPCQIRVRSGTVTLTNDSTDTVLYGLIVE